MSNRAADAMDAPFVRPKRKQSKDDSLRKVADRIQARAIRRCGELLKQIQPAFGARTDLEPNVCAVTRSKAASDAGLSERQKVTALRVASVPDDEFNAVVESDSPETVTQAPCVPPGAPFGSVSNSQDSPSDPGDLARAIEAIRAALSSVTDA